MDAPPLFAPPFLFHTLRFDILFFIGAHPFDPTPPLHSCSPHYIACCSFPRGTWPAKLHPPPLDTGIKHTCTPTHLPAALGAPPRLASAAARLPYRSASPPQLGPARSQPSFSSRRTLAASSRSHATALLLLLLLLPPSPLAHSINSSSNSSNGRRTEAPFWATRV